MINSIKQTYFSYKPNEFLPVYSDGFLNKRQFHIYRIKRILSDPAQAYYEFTHFAG